MFNKVISALRVSLFLVLSSCFLVSACVPSSDVEEPRVPTQRPHNQAARVLTIQVPRAEYSAAVRNVDMLRRLRLVEVVASEEVGRSIFPEYRLFNIEPKGPYALLGLVEGDILISANDYVLNDPERFRRYVQVLMRESGDTFIEIRRQGEEIILRFVFV